MRTFGTCRVCEIGLPRRKPPSRRLNEAMAEQRVRSVFQDLYPPGQPAEMEMRAQLKRIVEAVACQADFLGAPSAALAQPPAKAGRTVR